MRLDRKIHHHHRSPAASGTGQALRSPTSRFLYTCISTPAQRHGSTPPKAPKEI
ncbi:hypothetical protein BU25DRAFT_410780 [Macroventuria anomochaeta]|uniref:Uncharacterized protein n=1 Tax=Macroventuria anomochaeta TaxID=301207 RepID=A0ACB6S029_9PLEO|nr:uncharacterized protein BU25DRAFT_410780 [Macroventuria anomochaeta]KAF2627636.1 hypothetical protein BU25DRAFT_410780 [Macroventuria anomochaeta]